MHGGPAGGLMGIHTAHMWKINTENPSLATDPDILELATQLVQASHSGDISGAIYYAPNTEFTDIKQGTTRYRSHSTARYFTTNDLNAVHSSSRLHTSADMHPVVFQNIYKTRRDRGDLGKLDEEGYPSVEYGYDNPRLIPENRASNCLSQAGRDLTEDEAKPQEQIEDRCYSLLVCCCISPSGLLLVCCCI